jgi:ABC-type branched-subunit amino acid transport system substrate-binding protein/ABC-type amino acid transport substrate-binding protein
MIFRLCQLFLLFLSQLLLPCATLTISVGYIVDTNYPDGLVEYEVIQKYFQATQSTVRITLHKYEASTQVSGMEALCSMLRDGVHAIIGPPYSSIANLVGMYTSKMHIPLLSYSATAPSLTANFDYFARTVANDKLQATVMIDVIQHFNWNQFCILYESSTYGLEGYTATYLEARNRGLEVIYSSLLSRTGNMTDLMTKAEQAHCRIFVIWCIGSMCHNIVEAANQMKLLKPGVFEYVFSDGLITNENDWTDQDIKEGLIGSFAIAPSIPHSQALTNYNNAWTGANTPPLLNYAYYAYDTAVAMLAAFESLEANMAASGTQELLWPMNLTNVNGQCIVDANSNSSSNSNSQYIYEHGSKIFDYLLNTTYIGLSVGGNVTGFESTGEPLSSFYSISQMQGYFNPKWINVGNESLLDSDSNQQRQLQMLPNMYIQWGLGGVSKPSDNLVIPDPLVFIFPMESLGFQELYRSNQCYDSVCRTELYSCPRSCYNGYAVEVAKKLASTLNVSYEFKHMSKDHLQYSGYDNFIKATVMQDTYNLNAHIAVGDITINSRREEDLCDFSQPFLRLSLGIMVREEDAKFTHASTVDSFLAPFTNNVWHHVVLFMMANLVLYLIFETTKKYQISVALKYAHKISVDESNSKNKKKIETLGRRYSITGKMLDHSKVDKRTLSTLRLILSSLVSVIEEPPFEIITVASKISLTSRNMFIAGLVAVYTANLASFLTRQAEFVGLSGFDEIGTVTLPKNKVCVVKGGSNEAWWNSAFGEGTCYKCNERSFLPDECLELLRTKKVKAFVHDDIILQFATRKATQCDFRMLQSTVYDQGFGMALKSGSRLTDIISSELLKLGESSWLTEKEDEFVALSGSCPLYPGDEGSSTEDNDIEELGQLGMNTLSSAFFVIWCLQLISLVTFYFETGTSKEEISSLLEEELGTKRFDPSQKHSLQVMPNSSKSSEEAQIDMDPSAIYDGDDCSDSSDDSSATAQGSVNFDNKRNKEKELKSRKEEVIDKGTP